MKLLLSILFCCCAQAQFVDQQPTLAQAIGAEPWPTVTLAWHVDWPSTNQYVLRVGTNVDCVDANIPLGNCAEVVFVCFQPTEMLYFSVIATNSATGSSSTNSNQLAWMP